MILTLLFLQAAATAAAKPPEWEVFDRTNAAGVHSVSASVIGADGLSRFVVKCDVGSEPIVSIQFLQPSPIGQSTEKPVSVRFDGGPAFTYNWQFPGSGTYITDTQAITTLTRFLVKAKSVGVETTNGSNFAVQASFVAPGGEAMIKQVLGACGYTLGVVPPPPPPSPAPQDTP